MRRMVALFTLVGVILAVPAVAYAHECVIATRSEKGIQNSDHGQWFAVNTDDFIRLVFEGDPAVEDIVAEHGEAFRQAIADAGLPTSFAIFENRTLGGKGRFGEELTPAYDGTDKSRDGKGVDHFFSGGYFDTYLEILFGLLS
ncbi:MAG TPA: hypothetical protein VF115_02650 [Acidimicrobiia bacterium]